MADGAMPVVLIGQVVSRCTSLSYFLMFVRGGEGRFQISFSGRGTPQFRQMFSRKKDSAKGLGYSFAEKNSKLYLKPSVRDG